MNRRKEVKRITFEILNDDEYSRGNDAYLIMRVVQKLEPELAGTTFVNVMQHINYRGISFETITRARRDWGEKNPSLKIEQAERARRKNEEEFYLEYSNHIPMI